MVKTTMSYALIENDVTQLCCAIRSGDVADIQVLLQAGVDINCTDRNGETVLHTAVWNDCVDVVHELISSGADVNQSNKNGQTPLHIAAGSGNADIARLLLEVNADTATTTKYTEMTALHVASQNGHTDTVKLLLDYGADTDTLDVISKSAAFYAANSEITDIFKKETKLWKQISETNNIIKEENDLMHKYLGLHRVKQSQPTAVKEMSALPFTSVISKKINSTEPPIDGNLIPSPPVKDSVMPNPEIHTNVKTSPEIQTNLKTVPVTITPKQGMKPGLKTGTHQQQRPHRTGERGMQRKAASNKDIQQKTEPRMKYFQNRPQFSQEHDKIMQMNVFDRLTRKKPSVQK